MPRLSVNVNKIASLRNTRGENNPNLLQTTLDIIRFGAQGITVHPRPDERHIRAQDVVEIAQTIKVELNVEGYPSHDFVERMRNIKPQQCTLVPDPPEALTSNAGWNVSQSQEILTFAVHTLKASGIRVSLFIDPFQITQAELGFIKSMGADRIELYTKAYADDALTLPIYQKVADWALNQGLELNAGHDLNTKNLKPFIDAIPEILEVSIGHALICDALYAGLEKTIHTYLSILNG